MEHDFWVDELQLAEIITAALKQEYLFLPHDRVVAENSIFEKIEFVASLEVLLNRLARRDGSDWFHLVKKTWHYRPFSIHRVDNKYRGRMDFVDQRSWGPYFDFQIRDIGKSKGKPPYSVQIHLYSRFWSPEEEKEIPTPEAVKKDYSQFRKLIATISKQEFRGGVIVES